MKWPGPDGYWASDDHGLIDAERVHTWISRESYWAEGRPREVMIKAIENSLVIGLYAADGMQVGFARVVTDYATYAWICDVFIDSAQRGHRLGTFLVETTVSHPDLRSLRQILMGEPGRTLYERSGFRPLVKPERWMERPGLMP
jgi:GNAT superfamily N-acetyltransferase